MPPTHPELPKGRCSCGEGSKAGGQGLQILDACSQQSTHGSVPGLSLEFLSERSVDFCSQQLREACDGSQPQGCSGPGYSSGRMWWVELLNVGGMINKINTTKNH